MKIFFALIVSLFSCMVAASEVVSPMPDAAALYQKHCVSCHGVGRLGGMGPALLPDNLARLKKPDAVATISSGRVATQMPGFSQLLSAGEIAALADYIYQAPVAPPVWSLVEIRASHQVYHKEGTLPDQPKFQADLQNLFIVVELGDHHATLLNGESFEPITRFATRYALHGGPKYSPDGRYVYFASRDGWISKYDIYNLTFVAEIRAGINTRNLAISKDGKYAIAGNYLPHSLVILDTRDLSPLKVVDVTDMAGQGSRVSAVYTAPQRNSFIAALKDVKEIWEIPYDGKFAIRRIATDDFVDDFFFDPAYRYLIGASRAAAGGKGANVHVLELNSGKKVATIPVEGMPHLGSGIYWKYQGRPVLVTPHLSEGVVSVIDMERWEIIKKIETLGPGFFMRSHSKSPYAWVDVFTGPNREAMHVVDKNTLEIVKTLRPAPGKTSAHVEFTKDGKYALLSIWEMDGAVIVYDSATLEEVKRIPMKKPSGKYNVYNKTHYEEGTSH
jgi:mono/diheme cytochrome c family protein/DNA-binding beta-propeller fold protein YncE